MAKDKFNGMKRAADWVGRKVITIREAENGFFIIPKGTKGVITSQSNTGLVFVGDKCCCCGVQTRISRLPYHAVQLNTEEI
ncbi:MAG: hypothetical protein KA524_00050 [Nitrosomonas sp.]|nr:hypothetical protein [Nitrosomonas sp.]MBP6075385.1 hypothetical protein [Nitrosomonas sp.]